MVQCPKARCNMSLIGHKFGEIESNHPLVWEAIVAFTKAAINSQRYGDILTPYPVCNGVNLDINKLRQLAQEIPPVKEIIKLTTQVPPRVSYLLNWIINSNRSVIKRIAKPIPFMASAHQFIFIQSTQKHAATFQELKKTRRSLWAFHGSRPENWHSIIRNGLVNASGTKLQTTGAVYGPGIYLSPYASVSYKYSFMTGDRNPRTITEEDGIPHNGFACIAICEVINEGLKQSNNGIWVQPNESHVMTRFLFVFDTMSVGGFSAVLSDPQYANQLDTAVRENWA